MHGAVDERMTPGSQGQDLERQTLLRIELTVYAVDVCECAAGNDVDHLMDGLGSKGLTGVCVWVRRFVNVATCFGAQRPSELMCA
jgi:hypothetical protein